MSYRSKSTDLSHDCSVHDPPPPSEGYPYVTLQDKFYEHLIVGKFNSFLLILRCLLTVSEPDHATVGNRRVAGAMCHKPRICSRGHQFPRSTHVGSYVRFNRWFTGFGKTYRSRRRTPMQTGFICQMSAQFRFLSRRVYFVNTQ